MRNSALCENEKFDIELQRMDEKTPNINNNKLYCQSLVEFTSYIKPQRRDIYLSSVIKLLKFTNARQMPSNS
jgi:hypothetical protein